MQGEEKALLIKRDSNGHSVIQLEDSLLIISIS